MNEFSTYEYAVRQRIEGKWLWARIGLVTLYVLFVLAWLAFGFTVKLFVQLLALIPLTTWMLIFFTWRYVSVEYEYSITSGEMALAKIYGNRMRRRFLTVALRDAVRIAPLADKEEAARAEAYHPEREFSAISSLCAPDIYFMLFEYEFREHGKIKKRRAILYFEATAKALQICRFYNPSATVMTKTQR